MKKKILIFIIPFLLTGCANVSYDVNIDKDLKVEENVFITATSEYFSLFYKDYPKTIVSEWYNTEKKNLLTNNNYTHELVTKDVRYPGVSIKKTYSTLSEFTNNTIFKNQVFENLLVITNEDLITLKSIGYLPYVEDETDNRYSVSNLVVKIKVPFIVEEHNADKVDKKTNTYTWIIKEETDNKEIDITFSKNKIYVYNLAMYISIIILSLLVIIAFYVIRKYVKKGKKNNKIYD